MMRLAPIGLLVLIGGCGQPEVDACEDFIKSGLKAPATYKRVSVETRNERISWEQHLREQPADRNNDMLKRSFELGQYQRLVSIQYDAANSFGTPLRDNQVCAFRSDKDGKVAERTRLEADAKQAKFQRDFRDAARSGILPSGKIDMPEPAFACCK